MLAECWWNVGKKRFDIEAAQVKATVLFCNFFCKRKRVFDSEFLNSQATQYRC